MQKNIGRISKLLAFCLILATSFQGTPLNTQNIIDESSNRFSTESLNFEGIKVLSLIGNGFGDSYWWMKNQLEDWGINYTTAGLTRVCSSCPNRPNITYITADILIADVNEEILSQFDCVFISSGVHYRLLSQSTIALNLISNAHEQGLVVASICSGSVPIARANDIVQGVEVAYFFLSTEYMQEAGAIEVYSNTVVTDRRIITSSWGYPYGNNAPVYQVCVAMVKEILGYSAFGKAIISPQIEGVGTNHTLVVEVNNLNDIFDGNISTEVSTVQCVFNSGSTEISRSYMTRLSDNTFAHNFTVLEKGNYGISLKIQSFGYGREVVHDATSFTIKKASGFETIILLSSFVAICLSVRIKSKNGKKC